MIIRKSLGEWIFDICNAIFMIILIVATAYPLLYVLFASISDPYAMMKHIGPIWKPLGFSLDGYRLIFKDEMVLTGYKNTVIYVFGGTLLNLVMTILAAYVLSRKDPYWKNPIMFFVLFTMFFSGGLIPNYLLVKDLNLIDTRWAMIIPGAISTYNMIIMRTSFLAIPDSLEESAKIDGANDLTILARIIIPLSKGIISVMILFYGVAHWNAWFNAMIYLRSRELYPLQLFLREILIMNSTEYLMTNINSMDLKPLDVIIKYAAVIISVVPILFVYPFLQKYFTKGVMIGAVKE